jgi:hypothetical protein
VRHKLAAEGPLPSHQTAHKVTNGSYPQPAAYLDSSSDFLTYQGYKAKSICVIDVLTERTHRHGQRSLSVFRDDNSWVRRIRTVHDYCPAHSTSRILIKSRLSLPTRYLPSNCYSPGKHFLIFQPREFSKWIVLVLPVAVLKKFLLPLNKTSIFSILSNRRNRFLISQQVRSLCSQEVRLASAHIGHGL